MPLRSLLLLLAGLFALTGCQNSNEFEKKSSFTSVYTGSFKGNYSGRSAKPFPDGLNRPALSRSGKRYFIEFRARNAESYGHASVAFGKLDSRGRVPRKRNGDLRPGQIEISGLAPASDSKVVYSAGHIIPVSASTGPSDGDDEEAYLLARYRINLTRSEFNKVVAIVKRRKGTKFWNGPTQSCVTYLRMIANDMGLKTPQGFFLPENFVRSLKRVNAVGGGSDKVARKGKRRGKRTS